MKSTCHNDRFNDSDTLQYNDRFKGSELDIAMLKHIEYITNVEGRQFTYTDFLSFKVDGIEYSMSHGTFRNKILQLKRANKVTLVINSSIGFYSIKGHKLSKRMTGNHTMVTTRNDPVYKMIENLPLDRQSIHNIRLKFKVPNLWLTLSSTELSKNKKSKEILVPIHIQDTVDIKLSVHKTNTVTVSIGCSLNPIKLDYAGHIRFYTLLARIEEQLRAKVNLNSDSITIPDNRYWIINMWHFGRDSLNEYSGEKFLITVEEAQSVLSRIYSKKINGKSRIRLESQEYPNQTVLEAINSHTNTNTNTVTNTNRETQKGMEKLR